MFSLPAPTSFLDVDRCRHPGFRRSCSTIRPWDADGEQGGGGRNRPKGQRVRVGEGGRGSRAGAERRAVKANRGFALRRVLPGRNSPCPDQQFKRVRKPSGRVSENLRGIPGSLSEAMSSRVSSLLTNARTRPFAGSLRVRSPPWQGRAKKLSARNAFARSRRPANVCGVEGQGRHQRVEWCRHAADSLACQSRRPVRNRLQNQVLGDSLLCKAQVWQRQSHCRWWYFRTTSVRPAASSRPDNHRAISYTFTGL